MSMFECEAKQTTHILFTYENTYIFTCFALDRQMWGSASHHNVLQRNARLTCGFGILSLCAPWSYLNTELHFYCKMWTDGKHGAAGQKLPPAASGAEQ